MFDIVLDTARKVSWSVFSRIWSEYVEIRSISSYSLQMQEKVDQKNSEYEHFSSSV